MPLAILLAVSQHEVDCLGFGKALRNPDRILDRDRLHSGHAIAELFSVEPIARQRVEESLQRVRLGLESIVLCIARGHFAGVEPFCGGGFLTE